MCKKKLDGGDPHGFGNALVGRRRYRKKDPANNTKETAIPQVWPQDTTGVVKKNTRKLLKSIEQKRRKGQKNMRTTTATSKKAE